MKKHILAFAALACSAAMLCGCTIDVNQLAGDSDGTTLEVSSAQNSSNEHSDVFYTTSESSEAPSVAEESSQPESEAPTSSRAFDETRYESKYITGAAEVALTADALYGSEEVASLKSGDKVSVLRSVTEYTFVYSSSLEKFGYVRTEYLTESADEVTIGNLYYIKESPSYMYKDAQRTQTASTLMQNDVVTVLAKRAGGIWRVADVKGAVGYIDSESLSDKKIRTETSSKSSKPSKPESKNESKTQSRSEPSSKAESSSKIEETVSGLYTGTGEPPEEYTRYVVDVDVGYLSLRDRPSADKSRVIGKLYYEDIVYMVDASGEFWYVYAPGLGMYGYVTGDPDYLYPEY